MRGGAEEDWHNRVQIQSDIGRQVPPLNKSNDLLGYIWEPLTMTYTDSDTNCGYGEGVRLNLSNSQLLKRQKICREAKTLFHR